MILVGDLRVGSPLQFTNFYIHVYKATIPLAMKADVELGGTDQKV